jgi:tubulin polyglutamylase TTLL4
VTPLPFAPEEDGDPKEADSGLPLLASAFEGAPPTIFFDYPPEYGPKKKGNRLMLVRGMPKMFYVHTNLVHPYNAVINTLKRAGFKQTSSMVKWSLFWSAQPKPEFLRAFHPYQKTNHFPASWHLGRKDLLARHMMRMQRRWGAEYEIQPVSFVLPDEQSSFVSAKEAMSKAVWIYKPANSSCGRGIRLLTKDSKVPKKPGVVQRYVHNPLLIRGYKFDLRVYVVVTSFDPLKIYIFDELLVRLATTKYQSSTKKLSERTMHLTNYSINKHNAAYVKNQDDGAASPTRQRDLNSGLEGEEEEEEKARGGEESDEVEGEGEEEDSAPREDMASKWCIADLKAYFQENGWDFSATWERIKDLAVKTLVAVEPAIVQLLHRGTAPGEIGCQSCFELFGFDVLLDQDLKPWLLEVNVSPSLSSSSPLDRRIKTMLCADVLTLVGMRPFSAKEVEQDLQKEREARLLGQGKGGRIAQRSVTQLLETDVADFSREDWAVIQSTYEEFMRKGHLQVAYPRPENVEVYAKYFPAQRYRNVTLAKWLLRDGAEVFRRIAREGC